MKAEKDKKLKIIMSVLISFMYKKILEDKHLTPNIRKNGLLRWFSGKVSANAGDMGSVPGLGRCPGEGNRNSFQCSCLGNPMDQGA